MPQRLIIAALMLVMLAGCASAKKSFKEGSAAEAEGRWAQATDQYIDALHRDPEFPGARERVRETGNLTIEGYLSVARGLYDRGRYDPALKEYAKIDRLMDRAAAVGVILDLSAEYNTRKNATLTRAIDDALLRAERIAADGRWRQSIDAYRDLKNRYRLSSNQLAQVRREQLDLFITGTKEELRDERYDRAETVAFDAMKIFGANAPESRPVHDLLDTIHDRQYQGRLASARDLMNEERYQSAYGQVQRALDVYGPEAPESRKARELHDRIIDLGTVQVAVMPIWWSHEIAVHIPDDLLDDLEHALELMLSSEPPLFISFVDPGDVRHAIYQMDYDRNIISPQRALTIADRLESDFVTLFTIDHFEYILSGRPETREVALRHGESTLIEVYPRRELHMKCSFALVSAAEGRVIHRQRLELSCGRKHRHAVYDGNLDNLLLTQKQHRWFDERVLHEIDHEIEQEIADTLARDLSELVYESILNYLP